MIGAQDKHSKLATQLFHKVETCSNDNNIFIVSYSRMVNSVGAFELKTGKQKYKTQNVTKSVFLPRFLI